MAISASCEVRGVIRFLQEEEHSATEIHRRLCRVDGDTVMSESSMRDCCRKLRDGRTDVQDEGMTMTALNCDWWTRSKCQACHVWKTSFSLLPGPCAKRLQSLQQIWLVTQLFETNEDLMNGVNNWLETPATPFLEGVCKSLWPRYKCQNLCDDYMTKKKKSNTVHR